MDDYPGIPPLTEAQREELKKYGFPLSVLQEVTASAQEARQTVEAEKSIAGEAHRLVYGKRAETYGHPRFDFTAIGKVWTGLLQDVLKPGTEIDAHRVAVLMTGLKLARLVKSPGHHDSRVDTIGYMLTMERLDEPEELITKTGKKLTEADIEKLAEEAECGELPKRPEGLIEGSGVQGHPRLIKPSKNPATGDLQTYTFPVGEKAPFQVKTIFAINYAEARAKFEDWLRSEVQEEEPWVQYQPPPPDPCDPEEVDKRWSPTETVNPSDEEIKLALDILKRRQDFHDGEATRLLVQGGGPQVGS